MKKLTIIIPCYNQIDLARRSLDYLRKQTFKDFSIVIVNDASAADYPSLIDEFKDLDIKYQKNENNLGAMANMFKCLSCSVETEYKMVPHEDDILNPLYIEKALKILNEEKEAVFLGSPGIWFDEKNFPISMTEKQNVSERYSIFDQKDFAKYLLKINKIIFGSIIYRSQFLSGVKFDLQTYDVLCDRPYLLEIMGGRKSVVLTEPMIWVRDHGFHDFRGKSIRPRHLFNLHKKYRDLLKGVINQNEFLKISTNDLLLSFPTHSDISFLSYIKEGQRLGLIKLKYLNKKGLFAFLSYILGKKNSYYLLKLLNS